MAVTTLLVKAQDIVKNTVMGGNIDVSKYVHIIKESQQFVIEPILGTKLYNKIISDYESNSLIGDYDKLLTDYIQPILVYSVAAEYILISSYNVANGGIFKNQATNTTAVEKHEVDFLVNKQNQKADAFIKRMQDFLCNTYIPEHTSTQDESYDLTPKRPNAIVGGWILD